jgi:A/G-specific adenine glycosylase
MNFASRLLEWYQKNSRDLPWRTTRDPYRIWISEIILQQTRVNQGLQYYYRFIESFPTIRDLAKSSEDQVLSLWQGLGYYSRARNLHFTASFIVDNYAGVFPDSIEKILQLKGIGHYTAAAIASIAFRLPVVAVDGNVTRLIARYYGITSPVDEPSVQKQVRQIGQELMGESDPGSFNQAMMDFGSMVCKPLAPLCSECPFFYDCTARIKGLQGRIPFKKNKIKLAERHFHFFFWFHRNSNGVNFFIEKRKADDIWKNLYQIPLIEAESEMFPDVAFNGNPLVESLLAGNNSEMIHKYVKKITHRLTHRIIYAYFHAINLVSIPENWPQEFILTNYDDFVHIGKPVLMNKFLESYIGNTG